MAAPSLMTIKRLVRSLPGYGVLAGSAAAMFIKFGASLMGFIMFGMAARQMQPSEFGSLAVIFNAMSFLSVAVVFGQETLISRSWGEYCGSGQVGLARGALMFGGAVTSGGALITAFVVCAAWMSWGGPDMPGLALAACLFLLAQTLMTFNARITLVSAGLYAAELPREILWRLIVVIALLIFGAAEIPFSATDFFLIAGLVLSLSLLYQAWRVSRVIPEDVRRAVPQFNKRLWCQRSFRMWLSSLLDSSSQYVEVIVIGFFLGPTIAAFYFSATRLTNVFAMIAGGVTTYATTHISSLFHADAKDELQGVLRSLAVMSTLLCISAFLTIVVFGKLLLSFYGPDYAANYPALLVLAAGASLTALAGPAPYLLLLTGHESTYPRIVGAGLALKLGLIALLGAWFGLMGAAVAGGISAAFTAIALVVACRRALKLDPSFLSALNRANRTELWLESDVPERPV